LVIIIGVRKVRYLEFF